jgi:DNA-binding NarL/FixJ family response regulator
MTLLSPRKLQILQMRADGLTCADIASDLGLQTNTVKTMCWVIRQALGADSMCQAVAMGIRRGIIT